MRSPIKETWTGRTPHICFSRRYWRAWMKRWCTGVWGRWKWWRRNGSQSKVSWRGRCVHSSPVPRAWTRTAVAESRYGWADRLHVEEVRMRSRAASTTRVVGGNGDNTEDPSHTGRTHTQALISHVLILCGANAPQCRAPRGNMAADWGIGEDRERERGNAYGSVQLSAVSKKLIESRRDGRESTTEPPRTTSDLESELAASLMRAADKFVGINGSHRCLCSVPISVSHGSLVLSLSRSCCSRCMQMAAFVLYTHLCVQFHFEM